MNKHTVHITISNIGRYYTMRIILLVLFSLFLLPSCYKRAEGCLDPLSSNFNPNADDACDDCCQNPTVALSLRHRLQDTFYKASDTVFNDLGQAYKLVDFSYYLTFFRLKSTVGNEWSGENVLRYKYQNEWKEEKVNAILVKPNTFDYPVNESRQYGDYDSLIFFAGLPESIRLADSIDVAESHVLSDSLFLRNTANEKIWASITIARGDTFSDTLNLTFTLSEAGEAVRLPAAISSSIGKNLTVNLLAEYSRWFRDVDIFGATIDVKKGVLENLIQPFFVE